MDNINKNSKRTLIASVLIALIVIGIACIIDSIGRHREKKIDKKLEEMEGEE